MIPRIFTGLLGCLFLSVCHPTVAAILSCKTDNGKTIFTDDPHKCGKKPAVEVHLNIPKQTRVNYRYPERLYDPVNSRWPIFIERPENPNDKKLYAKAVARLSNTLDMAFKKFPQATHSKLKTVNFYIMRGPKHSLGGETAILRYTATGVSKTYLLNDKKWDNSIVIYDVENYLYQNTLWNNLTMVHELAHAWHFLEWTYQYQPIIDTWLNSRNSGLFQSVKDRKGKLLKPAYATTNEREYFAELSALYFVDGAYYPYDKQGLAQYDPKGFRMIESAWFTQGAKVLSK
jgi:hypothetical protein